MAEKNNETHDAVLGLTAGRATIEQIARDQGCSDRAVRNYLDRLHVPYVKILNVRYYGIDDVRTALIGPVHNEPPKRRGRPSVQNF